MHRPTFSHVEILKAYLDCRRRKRGTANALRFEMGQAANLLDLQHELEIGSYRPSRSVCFVNLRPKPREIFAANFRDRIVHHLLVRNIEPHWERVFIHDSYACRPGKGTHAAVDRLSEFVRSATHGGRRRAWFLQFDVHNFFMSIDKTVLFELVKQGMRKQFGIPKGRLPLFAPNLKRFNEMLVLARTLIFHDPASDYVRRSPEETWGNIPPHKSLFNCPKHQGLPIGNLTSQFFGNVYLNGLDQFVKHELKASRYVRYVDDAIIVSESKEQLVEWKTAVEQYLADHLKLTLNPGATRLRSVSCGINFLGYIVHPDHRLTRRRVSGRFEQRLDQFRKWLVTENKISGTTALVFDHERLEQLLATLNSYLAHLSRSSCHNLVSDILARHNWLSHYIDMKDFKAARNWRPASSARIETIGEQWRWFRTRWKSALVMFQVGSFAELYGQDALWAMQNLGLRELAPRFGCARRTGFPMRLVPARAARAVELGRDVLIVKETGYPLYSLKERLPSRLLMAGLQ